MSDPFEGRPFPRAVLIGAGLLITFVIALAAFVRMTGVGKTTLEPAEAVVSRSLRFDDQGNGQTLVYDQGQDAVIARLHSGEDGFVYGVLRAMGRERMKVGADKQAPYLVSLREDGRLLLEDPETGYQIDLRAFGPDNAGAFSELLNAEVQLRPGPEPADAN